MQRPSECFTVSRLTLLPDGSVELIVVVEASTAHLSLRACVELVVLFRVADVLHAAAFLQVPSGKRSSSVANDWK